MFLGLEDGTGDFLNKLIDPPSRISIESSLSSLTAIGAVAEDLSLTPLGERAKQIEPCDKKVPLSREKLLFMATSATELTYSTIFLAYCSSTFV